MGARRGNQGAPPTLVSYFGRRGSTIRPADSFRIFCGVLSLLKTLHSRGVTLRRVRPSMLRITSSGVSIHLLFFALTVVIRMLFP